MFIKVMKLQQAAQLTIYPISDLAKVRHTYSYFSGYLRLKFFTNHFLSLVDHSFSVRLPSVQRPFSVQRKQNVRSTETELFIDLYCNS